MVGRETHPDAWPYEDPSPIHARPPPTTAVLMANGFHGQSEGPQFTEHGPPRPTPGVDRPGVVSASASRRERHSRASLLVHKSGSQCGVRPASAFTCGCCTKPAENRRSPLAEACTRGAVPHDVAADGPFVRDAMAILEPTLRSDPAASLGVYATATRESSSDMTAAERARPAADDVRASRTAGSSARNRCPPVLTSPAMRATVILHSDLTLRPCRQEPGSVTPPIRYP